jgi:hypothetical protein
MRKSRILELNGAGRKRGGREIKGRILEQYGARRIGVEG